MVVTLSSLPGPVPLLVNAVDASEPSGTTASDAEPMPQPCRPDPPSDSHRATA